jgi:hypothetical protein
MECGHLRPPPLSPYRRYHEPRNCSSSQELSFLGLYPSDRQ